MTPTFSRRARTPLKEKRRRRWVHTYAPFLAIIGVALDRLSLHVDSFPPSWRPYIIGGSIAFGLTAVSETLETRRDYRKYIQRQGKTGEHDNGTT